jgi:hypothetical protein
VSLNFILVFLSSLFLETLIDIILSTFIFSLFLYKKKNRWFSFSSVSFQCFPQTDMLYTNINVFMFGLLFSALTFVAVSFMIALNMTAWGYTSLLSPLLVFSYSGLPNFNLTQFVQYCMSYSLSGRCYSTFKLLKLDQISSVFRPSYNFSKPKRQLYTW